MQPITFCLALPFSYISSSSAVYLLHIVLSVSLVLLLIYFFIYICLPLHFSLYSTMPPLVLQSLPPPFFWRGYITHVIYMYKKMTSGEKTLYVFTKELVYIVRVLYVHWLVGRRRDSSSSSDYYMAKCLKLILYGHHGTILGPLRTRIFIQLQTRFLLGAGSIYKFYIEELRTPFVV